LALRVANRPGVPLLLLFQADRGRKRRALGTCSTPRGSTMVLRMLGCEEFFRHRYERM
jgi:hypothetical protein